MQKQSQRAAKAPRSVAEPGSQSRPGTGRARAAGGASSRRPPASRSASLGAPVSWDRFLRAADGGRSDLVPLLQRAQEALGYLSPEAVRLIARRLKVSESEVFGVATFYAQFRFTPPGRHRLRVCLGTACHVKGGVQMLETMRRRLGVEAGQTTADGEYDLERVACVGCCALAPVVALDRAIYGQMSVLKLQAMLDERDRS
jgi:NADH-quinone oxidoreductase subunit E